VTRCRYFSTVDCRKDLESRQEPVQLKRQTEYGYRGHLVAGMNCNWIRLKDRDLSVNGHDIAE